MSNSPSQFRQRRRHRRPAEPSIGSISSGSGHERLGARKTIMCLARIWTKAAGVGTGSVTMMNADLFQRRC